MNVVGAGPAIERRSVMPQRRPDPRLVKLHHDVRLGLARIWFKLDRLSLHQELRETALRFRAKGIVDSGFLLFERVKAAPADPFQRMQHFEQLWSFDPLNASWIPPLLESLDAVERAKPAGNFSPVKRWLRDILEADAAGA